MRNRKLALNGMRGLMAVAIFLSHCGYLKYYARTEGMFQFVFYLYGAVPFFFIMSGYFFEYTCREESFKSFTCRKIGKLYPLHILTLCCSAGLIFLQGKLFLKEQVFPFLANVLLVQSWIPDAEYYYSFNAVSWFLSSLLGCYIIGFLLNKYKVRLRWIIILGYGLQVVLCIVLKSSYQWLLYINPLLRAVDFCAGMSICRWSRRESIGSIKSSKPWIYTIGEAGAVSLFVLAVFLSRYINVNWTYNVIFIIPSIIIVAVFARDIGGYISKLLSIKGIQWLGNCSLELFMTHKFIVNHIINIPVFIRIADKYAFAALAVIFVLCVGLAGITHMFLKYVTNFCYSKRKKIV